MADARTRPPLPSGRDRVASGLERRSGVAALEYLRLDGCHDCLEAR